MSIFDELADRFGRPESPVECTHAMPAVHPRPRPRPTAAPPAAGADRDALLHRHLDEIAGSLHIRLTHMEARIMSALANLTDQIANVEGTWTGTVGPALAQLAAQAQTAGSGISEADVQAAADRLSTIASAMASATQTALAQAGVPAQPVPVTVTPAG